MNHIYSFILSYVYSPYSLTHPQLILSTLTSTHPSYLQPPHLLSTLSLFSALSLLSQTPSVISQPTSGYSQPPQPSAYSKTHPSGYSPNPPTGYSHNPPQLTPQNPPSSYSRTASAILKPKAEAYSPTTTAIENRENSYSSQNHPSLKKEPSLQLLSNPPTVTSTRQVILPTQPQLLQPTLSTCKSHADPTDDHIDKDSPTHDSTRTQATNIRPQDPPRHSATKKKPSQESGATSPTTTRKSNQSATPTSQAQPATTRQLRQKTNRRGIKRAPHKTRKRQSTT
ncbi:extensin-like [Penaeus monodon]|uniref:extensin-like n=1 Tax=Penaeus monodon TaxID=6687 RepID=UPI0018A74727|nr:extensin-like [Penaeus monodon]